MRVRTRRLGAAVVSAAMVTALPVSAAQAGTQAAKIYPKKPAGVTAQAGYLFDATKKRVLWSKNADRRMQIGSITKVMTALVVIKAGHLDRKIPILQKYLDYIPNHDASGGKLVVGDTLTAGQLIQAMLME